MLLLHMVMMMLVMLVVTMFILVITLFRSGLHSLLDRGDMGVATPSGFPTDYGSKARMGYRHTATRRKRANHFQSERRRVARRVDHEVVITMTPRDDVAICTSWHTTHIGVSGPYDLHMTICEFLMMCPFSGVLR